MIICSLLTFSQFEATFKTSLMILFQGLFSDKVYDLVGPLLTYSRPLSFYSEKNESNELKVGITRNKQKLAYGYLFNK